MYICLIDAWNPGKHAFFSFVGAFSLEKSGPRLNQDFKKILKKGLGMFYHHLDLLYVCRSVGEF